MRSHVLSRPCSAAMAPQDRRCQPWKPRPYTNTRALLGEPRTAPPGRRGDIAPITAQRAARRTEIRGASSIDDSPRATATPHTTVSGAVLWKQRGDQDATRDAVREWCSLRPTRGRRCPSATRTRQGRDKALPPSSPKVLFHVKHSGVPCEAAIFAARMAVPDEWHSPELRRLVGDVRRRALRQA